MGSVQILLDEALEAMGRYIVITMKTLGLILIILVLLRLVGLVVFIGWGGRELIRDIIVRLWSPESYDVPNTDQAKETGDGLQAGDEVEKTSNEISARDEVRMAK